MLSPSELAPRPAWLLVVAMLAFAACSSDAAAPTTTEPTASTAAESTTTTAPSTTSTTAPPSTAPPTSSEAEIEAELVRVVEAAHVVLATPADEVSRELLAAYYSPGLAETVWQGLQQEIEDGLVVEGEFDVVEFLGIAVSGDAATVRECGIDATSLVDADGQLVVAGDVDAYVREYQLSRQDGIWTIDGISFPGSEKELCGAS